jgi:hypothetical protein
MLINQTPYLTTGIGSLPHKDPGKAVELVLGTFDIPFWPQLPQLSFRELMIPQYTEGMPLIRVDEEKRAVWVDRSATEELERFYEGAREDMRLAISENSAEGLHAFLSATRGRSLPYLKGHITGPLTFTLGISDSAGKAVYYDEELREIYLMCLKAKARWQADVLGARAEDVVIFVDEPVFSSIGSTAYLGVSNDEAVRLLTDIVFAIKDAGAVAGIHCCGRADWPLLLKTGIDILNFDSFNFGETIGLYPNEMRLFLEGGGTLAWGAVPTTPKEISEHDEEKLRARFMDTMESLSRHIPQMLLKERVMLTPSCGAGGLSEGEAAKVFQLLVRLKEALI